MNPVHLTKCEFEIADRLALGESKKEVACHTHRSLYTVETTVKNIYEKLGFNKISDLVLWYCGCTFNISYLISERKRQVLTGIFLILISINILLDESNDVYRCRRRNTRRKNESELFIDA